MRRLEDWPARLFQVVEAARTKPFQWGQHDCILFARDCILAETGVDMGEGLTTTYDDLASAIRGLRDFCGGGLEQFIEHFARKYNCQAVNPALAQRGDATIYDDPAFGPAVGICLGELSAHLGLARLEFVPMRLVRRAWAI